MRWGWICVVSAVTFAVAAAWLAIRYVGNRPSSKPVVDLALLALVFLVVSLFGLVAGRSRRASARR